MIFGSPYPIATAPSAIVQSTSSPPSVVSTRQPAACVKCVGPAGLRPFRKVLPGVCSRLKRRWGEAQRRARPIRRPVSMGSKRED